MSRHHGELVDWDDDRGFGFIRADDGQRLFVHIKSIRRIVNRPRAGDRMSFTVGNGHDGRPAAVNAEIVGANPLDGDAMRRGAVVPRSPTATLRIGAAALLALAATAVAVIHGQSLYWLPLLYLGAGVVGIAAYWLDKNAAEAGRWRIPENTLHLIDLCFGVAGGLLAQALLRHKTSKPSFAAVSFVILGVHLAALATLALAVIGG
jgi:uncharacterized membrane protein YsdA (DUF1294 family)/cold shock CspA family protein